MESFSPRPQQTNNDTNPTPMNFFNALKKVKDGKRIYKQEWNNRQFFGVMDNEILKLHKPDNQLHNWIISAGDMAGEDWIVVA